MFHFATTPSRRFSVLEILRKIKIYTRFQILLGDKSPGVLIWESDGVGGECGPEKKKLTHPPISLPAPDPHLQIFNEKFWTIITVLTILFAIIEDNLV